MLNARSPQPNLDAAPAYPPRFWLLLIATGVAIGLAGGGLMLLLHAVERLAWGPGNLLDAIDRTGPARRVLNLALAGVVVGVGGALLRRAFDNRGGDVNAAVWLHAGRVDALPTLARAIHSIVAVGLGMSLGREAAIKQTGGAIASRLAAWADVPPDHRRLLVAAGVGAGMAAAYNVPLGGALFATEVLLGTMALPLVLPAVVMSAVATAASWVFLPTGPIYRLDGTRLTAAVAVWSAVAGPAFGLLAVAVVRAVGWAGAIRLPRPVAVVAPIVAFAGLGGVAIALPQLLGNGMEVVQLALGGQLSLTLLLALPLLKLAATAGCMAAGGRGGLFTPTMTVGATAGGLLGHLWACVWPGVDPGLSALIGAGAVLAASSQGPVSSVVLVLELTRHGDATMVPMLLAVTGATLTAGWLEPRSVYTVRVPRGPTPPPGTP